MKRFLVSILAAGLTATAAVGADLNVSVESGGLNAVTVAPGDTVDYAIVGELSDNLNEGLALFGFDLSFDGGDLAQASAPGTANIAAFVSPDGINNPAGFGGTIIAGDLKQVGGGQNTIKNDSTNAPFPLGLVVTGVAQPGVPEVLAVGSLTAPMTPGTYHLTLTNLFANVIRQGETGLPPQNFWKTEAAVAGTVADLTITVGDVVICQVTGSTPPNCATDARQPTNLDGTVSFGWDSITIDLTCDTTANVQASDFAVTVDSGVPPNIISGTTSGNSITLQLDGAIPVGQWTCFEYTPSAESVCLGYLPADVNGDHTSAPADILAVIDSLNGVTPLPVYATDADRSGVAGPEDILRVIDLLNGAASLPAFLDVSIGACPSAAP
ncbi:MAG: hypothetical protein ACE5E5_00970 [Phycisphaerae bacterium]